MFNSFMHISNIQDGNMAEVFGNKSQFNSIKYKFKNVCNKT